MDSQSYLNDAKKILKKNKQEHLLSFYDELTAYQQESLISQILDTDFANIGKLYKNSFTDEIIEPEQISPISYYSKQHLLKSNNNSYISIGESIIKNGELAILTLAGGQGTRLGFNGPKGCYEIDIPPKRSLFEFICDKLKKAFELYNVYLPWYIMTSPSNNSSTISYFEKNDFFDYPKEKVFFFSQSTLPVIDTDGKIILDNLHTIKTASNGNGDVFRAFKNANLEHTLLEQNIKWLSISGIDNIILDIIDPLFIGLTISSNCKIAAKSIAKSDLLASDWIFANVDKKPCIIDPDYLTEEMLYSKNENGLYNYNQINILSHLISTDAFLLSSEYDLPYHRAYKKSHYINSEGMKIVPSSPNSFKFEKFIFDAFKYFNDFTLLEVEPELEFAPIKAFTGAYTPETALELYLKKITKR